MKKPPLAAKPPAAPRRRPAALALACLFLLPGVSYGVGTSWLWNTPGGDGANDNMWFTNSATSAINTPAGYVPSPVHFDTFPYKVTLDVQLSTNGGLTFSPIPAADIEYLLGGTPYFELTNPLIAGTVLQATYDFTDLAGNPVDIQALAIGDSPVDPDFRINSFWRLQTTNPLADGSTVNLQVFNKAGAPLDLEAIAAPPGRGDNYDLWTEDHFETYPAVGGGTSLTQTTNGGPVLGSYGLLTGTSVPPTTSVGHPWNPGWSSVVWTVTPSVDLPAETVFRASFAGAVVPEPSRASLLLATSAALVLARVLRRRRGSAF